MIQFADTLRFNLAKRILPLDQPTTLPNPKIILHMLQTLKDASWYINYRDDPTILIAYTRSKYFKGSKTEEEPIKEKSHEFVLTPDESKYSNRVIVGLKDSYVFARVAYNKDFIEIMHSLNYQWDNSAKEWIFPLDPTTGDPIDRAAECACVLVDAGWNVVCGDEKIYERSLKRSWQPMYGRWVEYNGKNKSFVILLREDNWEIKEKIKQIQGVRTRNKQVLVPETNIKQVIEFVNEYGFRMTEKVKEKIEEL